MHARPRVESLSFREHQLGRQPQAVPAYSGIMVEQMKPMPLDRIDYCCVLPLFPCGFPDDPPGCPALGGPACLGASKRHASLSQASVDDAMRLLLLLRYSKNENILDHYFSLIFLSFAIRQRKHTP